MAEIITLSDYRETVIVVGTSVRKSLPILQAHLDSLAAQDLPPRVRLLPVYVPDFAPDQNDAQALLFKWVNERNGVLIQGLPQSGPDFADHVGTATHEWQPTAMARVGAHKNIIIKYALANKADYLFFCDADLMLDRTTIRSLLSCDRPLVTATYWTHWQRNTQETAQRNAMPQVWLGHPYQLDGHGMDAAEFRGRLLSRELLRVFGFGACTLIQRKVLEAGITFEYLPDVPQTGMFAGEDRHFCIRCERSHIDAYADTWPDIFHIYHAATDVPQIPAMAARLGTPHPRRPVLGDLVSLRLRALEPVPVAPNRLGNAQPQFPRGRLGSLALLPELEAAILGMERGQTTMVRAHFPVHYPIPFLRGRARLIEIALIDCKPFGAPPTVEDELYMQGASFVDSQTLTPAQVGLITNG